MENATGPTWEETARTDYVVEIERRDGDVLAWRAHLKHDGCLDLWRFYNGGDEEDRDYIHVCDVGELIRLLLALDGHKPAAWEADSFDAPSGGQPPAGAVGPLQTGQIQT